MEKQTNPNTVSYNVVSEDDKQSLIRHIAAFDGSEITVTETRDGEESPIDPDRKDLRGIIGQLLLRKAKRNPEFRSKPTVVRGVELVPFGPYVAIPPNIATDTLRDIAKTLFADEQRESSQAA